MLVVAKSPVCDYAEQSESRGYFSGWRGARAFAAGADLFVDQRKQCRENQAECENDEQDGLDDENYVPGNPTLGKRPEGAHSVIIGEVEENVAEAGEAGVGEEQSPARRKIGITGFAAAQSPEEIDESNDHGRDQRDAQERMSEAAMMVQAERGTAEAAEDVEG